MISTREIENNLFLDSLLSELSSMNSSQSSINDSVVENWSPDSCIVPEENDQESPDIGPPPQLSQFGFFNENSVRNQSKVK